MTPYSSRKNTKKPESWRSLRLLTPFFRRYWPRLALGFLALLTVDFLQLTVPRIIKLAVDGLEKGTASPASLLRYAMYIVCLALGIAFFRFGWRYLILGFSRLLERDLREKIMSHILSLDRLFFQRHTTGEIMALSSNDLAAVQLAYGMGLVAFVDAVVMTVAALGFMAYIHPTLTLIAVLPMPILALLTRVLAARLHKRFKKVQERFSRITEFVRSSLTFIRLIKAYTQEECQNRCFDRLGKDYIRDNLRLAMVQGTLFPAAGLVANISMLLVLYFGGSLTVKGAITVGDFVAFITYLFMLTWPMMAFGWVANLFQRGATSLGRLQDLFEEKPVLEDVSASGKEIAVKGELAVRDLSFSYDGQKYPALDNISLDIKPGILGIVGRSGSGKSTLCQLLVRIYPVADRTILLDGIDVNRLPLDTVRGAMAYVPQEDMLFSETIAANIALGKPKAGRPEIEAVAKAAAIHDEIMAMEKGYETRIGEKGVMISGGQRQRIALARALLLDRPILIIDDGLSAVDTETERKIIQALGHYLKDRTCIIVSHRVAPLIEANSILVLEKGKIAAQGRHEQLLATNRFYTTIYTHQMSSGNSSDREDL